jgi:SNF2 family DNA or RNA helicase
MLQAYASTGKAKIKGVLAFLETLIEGGVKFLCFAHHYVVLDRLEDYMLKNKVNYIRIDGRIDVKKRYDAVNKF